MRDTGIDGIRRSRIHVTTETATKPARHGLTRGQYVAVAIGVVVVLIAAFFVMLWLTMRPNLQGVVTIADRSGTVRPLANTQVSLIQQKYGLKEVLTTDAKGHFSTRVEVDTYRLQVVGCPYVAHSYVTLSLGQVTTRNIACLTTKPAK
jgi:hypothetical protein